jgi:hypothetical protein
MDSRNGIKLGYGMSKSPAESQEDSIAFFRMREKIEKLEEQVMELMTVLSPLITAMKPPPQETPKTEIIVVERRFNLVKGKDELVPLPHQESQIKQFIEDLKR